MVMRQRVRIKECGVQHNTRDVSFLGGPTATMKAGPSTVTITLEFDATDPKQGEKLTKLLEDQRDGHDLMLELSTIRADKGLPVMPDIEPQPRTEFDPNLGVRSTHNPITGKPLIEAKQINHDTPTTPPPEGTW